MDNKEAFYVLNELLEKVKVSPNKTNILAKEKQALELAIEMLNKAEEKSKKILEQISDINFTEIKSHDTDKSLQEWLDAWHERVKAVTHDTSR